MNQRLGLHHELCSVLASFGVWLWDPFQFDADDLQSAIEKEAKRHVYFQPPEGFRMSYPCIVYELVKMGVLYADNRICCLQNKYRVTVIDNNPDSKIPSKVLALPLCSHNTQFKEDNLYHSVFTIYR